MKNYLDIKVPNTSAFTISTRDDFIQLHAVILACAKRGGSKTTALSNLLRMMKDNNALDRLIIVSPTYHNNKHYFEGLPIDEENDIIEPEVNTAQDLMDMLELEGEMYDEYIDKMKRYNELMKLLKDSRKNIDEIDDELLLEFDSMEKPTYKYMRNGKAHKPTIAIFFDDCQGSDLFKPKSKISNMVIKHRHSGKTQDGSIGCTLLFACQNYTSSSMGLPKSIRGNLTHMLLMKNKNMNELKLIAQECSGEVDEEQFFKLYDKALQEKYDFLFIDFAKKKEHPSMFRRNFNEWLIPDK
jgi:hypothetical protein